MDNGELVAGNDDFSAEGYNLVSISAIWADGYDELLTELYSDSCYASPYTVSVEGYVPGEPITLTVTMPADILMPENVAVYYIDADGNYRRIDNITVREVEQEEPPADEEAEQEELPTDEEVEQKKLLLTEVEFTVTELGVFAVGNEPGIHYWHDDYIDLYAVAHGLTGVSAVDAKANVDTGKTFTDYICYTVTPEGIGAEDYASYAVVMPENFDMDNLVLYAVTAQGLVAMEFTKEYGVDSFEYFGAFTFACGDAALELQALKPAEDGNGFIVRLAETAGAPVSTTATVLGVEIPVSLPACGIGSWRVADGKAAPCNYMEEPLA
jgi:hypothetical protein